MVFVRFGAALLAIAALGWGPADAAGPLRAFKVGFWSGGAYTDDRTGDFTHCSAGVAYDSGTNMFVLVTAGYRWWLGFIDQHWAFSPKVPLAVELRLDGNNQFPRFATVPSGQLLLIPLPYDSRVIDALRRSSELSLTAAREAFRFQLDDTSAILEELTGCVRKSIALQTRGASLPSPTVAPASLDAKPPRADAATSSQSPLPAEASPGTGSDARGKTADLPSAATAVPPGLRLHASRELGAVPSASSPPVSRAPPATPAPAPASLDLPGAAETPAIAAAPPPFPVQPTQPTASEEIKLAQDFFTTARLSNARLVVTDKPAALASFAAVWRSDNAAGAVKIIPPGPDVSGIAIASNLIAVDPQMCQGNFATARSSATIERNVVFSAVLSCTEANEQRSAQYFITQRRQGGFVVFAVVGSGAADGSAGSDQQRLDLLAKAAARAAQDGG